MQRRGYLVRSVVKPDLRGNLALHMTFPVNSGGPSSSIWALTPEK